MAVIILLWLGILAGVYAMRDLRACAKTHPGFEAKHIQGHFLTRVVGLTTLVLVPIVFMVTWLVLRCR